MWDFETARDMNIQPLENGELLVSLEDYYPYEETMHCGWVRLEDGGVRVIPYDTDLYGTAIEDAFAFIPPEVGPEAVYRGIDYLVQFHKAQWYESKLKTQIGPKQIRHLPEPYSDVDFYDTPPAEVAYSIHRNPRFLHVHQVQWVYKDTTYTQSLTPEQKSEAWKGFFSQVREDAKAKNYTDELPTFDEFDYSLTDNA